jgi:nitrogen regulatory protein PII-like uncharacterized protein
MKLVKTSLYEKFEKESDPIKDMGIGFKLYRCGYCGVPTDKAGNILEDEEYELAIEAIENGTEPEDLTICDICEEAIDRQEYEEERREEEQRWYEEEEERREEEQRWREENEEYY